MAFFDLIERLLNGSGAEPQNRLLASGAAAAPWSANALAAAGSDYASAAPLMPQQRMMPVAPDASQGSSQQPAAAPRATAMDVWNGTADQGRATNGDILRRLPSGQVERTSTRYGTTQIMPVDPSQDAGYSVQPRSAATQKAAGARSASGASPFSSAASSAPAASEGGFGGFLQNLLDPEAKGRNATVSWLVKQGYDPGTAEYIARDKPLLQNILREHVTGGGRPKYDFMNVDGTLIRTDSYGNAVSVGHFGQDGARPMTPTERLKWGIPQDDKRPYAMTDEGPKLIGGNGVTVNTSYGSEKSYDRTVGEGYGKSFLTMRDDASAARRTLTGLDVMEQAMRDPNFYSGTGEPFVNGLKRIGASIGVNPDSVTSVETFNAMSKQAALDSMGGSLGTGFSNADRQFVVDQVPSLANTPAGNQKLIGILRKIAQRKVQLAQLAQEYAADHDGRIDAGFDSYLTEWGEANPLFSDDLFPEASAKRPEQNPPFQQGPSGNGRGAGTDTGRVRARNPQTGETLEWDGTAWRPVR
jgi:hypothetical protein